jgi:hypothetical protein
VPDDTPAEPEPMEEGAFHAAFADLLNSLAEHIASAEEKREPRVFPPDTRIGDLPDDMTPEESGATFGTKYDPTTEILTKIMQEVFKVDDEGIGRLHKEVLKIIADSGLKAPDDDDTVAQAMPKVAATDLIMIGYLAHYIVDSITSGNGPVKVDIVGMGAALNIGGGGLFNGKGPFG